MRWLRLYSSVLHDPKVQRLPPALFKHWINLLCLANESDPRGLLPCVEDIAYALRIKPCEARTVMTQLTRAGLVDETEEGRAFPHNWTERQRDSDDVAARVARHRRRKSGNEGASFDGDGGHVTLHATLPVTPAKRPVDPDTERDTDPEDPLRDHVPSAAAAHTSLPRSRSAADPAITPAADEAQGLSELPPAAAPPQPKPPKLKPIYGEDSVPMQLARTLAAGIHRNKPDAKLPRDGFQEWAREFDLMLRVDHRPREKIEAVVAYAMASTFWRKVIFSASKIREKFDVIDAQRQEDSGRGQHARGQSRLHGAGGRAGVSSGGRAVVERPAINSRAYYEAAARRLGQGAGGEERGGEDGDDGSPETAAAVSRAAGG